jgi:hypothetical protein
MIARAQIVRANASSPDIPRHTGSVRLSAESRVYRGVVLMTLAEVPPAWANASAEGPALRFVLNAPKSASDLDIRRTLVP